MRRESQIAALAKTNHWLKNRSGLIKRIIIDLSLGLAASGIAFSLQGEEERIIERCLLSATIWTAGNYITGEYNGRSLGNISKTAERIARVGVSTVILALVINILSNKEPGTAGVAMVCTIAASLSVTSRDITQKKISWIFAGSRKEQDLIGKELSSRSKELWIKRDQAGDNAETGIVVGNQSAEESAFNNQELTRWKSSGREICTVSEWFERHEKRLPSHLIGNNYAVERQWPRIAKGTLTWRIKRIGDLVVGLPLLIVLTPVMAIAAAAVYAEDKKNPIYSQIRNGMNGKKFRIWKIRSMGSRWIIDSTTGRKQASKYVTTVGRFIRKHRIDELPQIINVLSGEMSLIGPRPERPGIDLMLSRKIKNYSLRLCVKPGITGWAQVNYGYTRTIDETIKKLSYDFFYIDRESLLLDLFVIAKTMWRIIKPLQTDSRGHIAKKKDKKQQRAENHQIKNAQKLVQLAKR